MPSSGRPAVLPTSLTGGSSSSVASQQPVVDNGDLLGLLTSQHRSRTLRGASRNKAFMDAAIAESNAGDDGDAHLPSLSDQLLAERRAQKAAAAAAVGKVQAQGSKRRLLGVGAEVGVGGPRNVKAKVGGGGAASPPPQSPEAPIIPQGAVSKLRADAQQEVKRADGAGGSSKALGQPVGGGGGCPTDSKGQLLDEACRLRARCAGCNGCRAKAKLSRVLEATDVQLVKTEHCTCHDRVMVRTEVLKNYESLLVRSRNAAAAADTPSGAAIHVHRVHDGVAEAVKPGEAGGKVVHAAEPATSVVNTPVAAPAISSKAQQSAASMVVPDVGSSAETVTSMTAALKKQRKKKQQQRDGKATTTRAVASDVVLKERVTIQGAYCYVTMRQMDEVLQVEAVDQASGELYVARTKLSRAYMDKKSNQNRDEIYRQILTQQLCFKKDLDDDGQQANSSSNNNNPSAGPRYMQKEERKRRLVIVVTAPSTHHHEGRRRRPRLPPFLSELMTLDGSVFLVKAHMEAADLLLVFSHQTYSLESFLAVPLVALPLLSRSRSFESRDARQLRVNVLKLLTAAGHQSATPGPLEEPANLPQLVRRLCQGISFKRVEANLHFHLQPILRVELQEILSEVALLQRSCMHIQRVVRGHQGRKKAEAWRQQAEQATIHLQAATRGWLTRRSFRRTIRRIVAVRRLRTVHKLDKTPFAVRVQTFMRLHKARKRFLSLLHAKRARERAEAEERARRAREEEQRRAAAATQIQSVARGRAAQKELDQRRLQREEQARRQRAAAEAARAKAEAEGATAIQAAFRAKAARAELARRQREEQERRRKEEVEKKRREEEEKRRREEEEARRRRQREREERGATVIQSVARAKAAREEAERRRAAEKQRQEQLQREAREKAAELERQAREEEEERRRKREQAEAEQRRRQQEEEERRRREEAAASVQALYRGHAGRAEGARRRQELAAERERKAREKEEAERRRRAEEEEQARKRQEETERRRREEEEEKARRRRQQQEEAATSIQLSYRGHAARSDLAARKAERAAQLEQQKKAGEEEAARRAELERQQKQAEEEARRRQAEEEARRRQAEEEARRRQAEEEARRRQVASATTIQTAYRGHAARTEVADRKAQKAAELERLRKQEEEEKRRREEAERRRREAEEAAEAARRRHEAAITVQSAYRGHAAKAELSRRKADKAAERERQAREQAEKRRKAEEEEAAAIKSKREGEAAVAIQSVFRQQAAKQEAARRRQLSVRGQAAAVLLVQRVWRGHHSRQALAQWQAWWAYQARCAVTIQRVWRGHYARAVLKPWRVYEVQQQQLDEQWRVWEQQQAAATRIQALARGRAARKQCKAERAARERQRKQQEEQSPEALAAFGWAREGDYESLIAALESGALDANLREAGTGQTLLMAAVLSREKYIMEWLVYYGADANAQDEDGNSALHLAKQQGFDEVADYLLETVHADPDIRNHEGHTYLYYDL